MTKAYSHVTLIQGRYRTVPPIQKIPLGPFVVNPLPEPKPLATTDIFSVLKVLPFREFYINGIVFL